MTLKQLLDQGMNTDITPLLHGLKAFAAIYLVAYTFLVFFVVVFFIFVSWRVFKGFRDFDKFNGNFKS